MQSKLPIPCTIALAPVLCFSIFFFWVMEFHLIENYAPSGLFFVLTRFIFILLVSVLYFYLWTLSFGHVMLFIWCRSGVEAAGSWLEECLFLLFQIDLRISAGGNPHLRWWSSRHDVLASYYKTKLPSSL